MKLAQRDPNPFEQEFAAEEAEVATAEDELSANAKVRPSLSRGFSAAFEKHCTVNEVALDDELDMSSSSQAPESWISAFCSLVGHEYFAEVSEDFIEDDFNLTGLQSQVPMYKEALEMILDVEPEDATDDEEDEEDEEDEDEDEMQDGEGRGGYRRQQDESERRRMRAVSDLGMIESQAEMLYGLIHQRFITSRTGIQQMAEKYELGHFGHCPRVYCHGAKVLPVGCSDIPGQETVKLFCPSCLDVYNPPNSRFAAVDGAFFGTTFGCLFFMTFPELEVGGQKPMQAQDPSISTSSPLSTSTTQTNNAQISLDKTTRSSLSSSLTSQSNAQNLPQNSNTPQQQQTQTQPESINGVAPKNLAPGLGLGNIYEPRIYGFRVSEVSKTGPRMKWLRSRPTDVNELDECRIWAQNQEEAAASQADLADSEMVDENEEIDEGDVEDEDMHVDPEEVQQQQVGYDAESAQLREVTQRKKPSRRRNHDALLNGDGGGVGTAVRVGDGG